MTKLLPYQETKLRLITPPSSLSSSSSFAAHINFMFFHDDDYIVIAYLLMMFQTISVIRDGERSTRRAHIHTHVCVDAKNV